MTNPYLDDTCAWHVARPIRRTIRGRSQMGGWHLLAWPSTWGAGGERDRLHGRRGMDGSRHRPVGGPAAQGCAVASGRQADVLQLPLRTGALTCWLTGLFPYLPAVHRTSHRREACRVLRPGGRLLLCARAPLTVPLCAAASTTRVPLASAAMVRFLSRNLRRIGVVPGGNSLMTTPWAAIRATAAWMATIRRLAISGLLGIRGSRFMLHCWW